MSHRLIPSFPVAANSIHTQNSSGWSLFGAVILDMPPKFPSQSGIWWLPAILILNFSAHVAATSLTEQHRLCKKNAEIENIEKAHGLIQVEATPAHAAFQPGWPETLYTLGLSLFSVLAALVEPEGGSFGFIKRMFIPFNLLVHWLVRWGIALANGATGG